MSVRGEHAADARIVTDRFDAVALARAAVANQRVVVARRDRGGIEPVQGAAERSHLRRKGMPGVGADVRPDQELG